MADHPKITVAQGILKGRKATSVTGSEYFSFQGVPYAKPPVGPLRFQPPEPPEAWDGERDATKEGPSSAQIDWIVDGPQLGQEDCLYLNVYTKELPGDNTPKKPVMFFIHGGGFSCGSSYTYLYGPDYLVEHEIVLVTINYRLGALGFLFVENASISPNNGLRDQNAALQWVQENIGAFGGDPNNVTIFGESAGGASVQFHVLSPLSKGLFHKAIAESGSVLNPWAMLAPEETNERTFRLGHTLGCDTDDPKTLISFLQSASADDIVKATREMFTEEEKHAFTYCDFVPINEGNISSEYQAFVPNDPLQLMKEGKFNNVPYMSGVTSCEGLLCLKDILRDKSYIKTVDENFEYLLFKELRKKENIKEITSLVKEYYFGGHFTEENIIKFAEFITHTWFLVGVQETVTQISRKSSFPVFYYQFAFSGDLNAYKKFVGAEAFPGASHIDDLGYLFTMKFMNLTTKPDVESSKTLKRMTKLWTNFAKTGKPVINEDEDLKINWPPYVSCKRQYMKIDNELTVHTDLLKAHIEFWYNLLSKESIYVPKQCIK